MYTYVWPHYISCLCLSLAKVGVKTTISKSINQSINMSDTISPLKITIPTAAIGHVLPIRTTLYVEVCFSELQKGGSPIPQ